MNLGQLSTETADPATVDLDTMTPLELVAAMNAADQSVAAAVARELPRIARAVELLVRARSRGGRILYVGAGTSGRLGLLDAVECPPTFGTDPTEVVGLLAGGPDAFRQAVEGAEDDPELGAVDLRAVGLRPVDVVVGLTASGRTPYVLGALAYAGTVGAARVAVSCNRGAEVSAVAEVAIEVDTGPEVLTGSTRLKAGTAQKMVCNMLTTAAMVGAGKVYRNLMVDVRPTNDKLLDRARRIVAAAADVSPRTAEDALQEADREITTAIVMLGADCSPAQARERLTASGGRVRQALAG